MLWSLGNEGATEALRSAEALREEGRQAMAYWFNISTNQVESDEERSRNADVMGPYDTEAEAAAALEIARAKTEAWDEEDEEWERGQG